MPTPNKDRDWKKEYEDLRPSYVAFSRLIRKLVRNYSPQSNVFLVQSRAKTIDSFGEKIERKKYQRPFDEMEDLAGVRIIVFSLDDIDVVWKSVEGFFEICDSSVKKPMGSGFGYLSSHYVVTMSDSRRDLSEYKKFTDYKAEIQIRTIVQHAWAEIDHRLRYKAKNEIQHDLSRRLDRMSALLEVVDTEFKSFLDEENKNKGNNEIKIKEGQYDVNLDVDSLCQYMYEAPLPCEVVEKAKTLGFVENKYNANAKRKEFSLLMNDDFVESIGRINDLDVMLRERENDVFKFLGRVIENWRSAVGAIPNKLVVTREVLFRIICVLLLDESKQLSEFPSNNLSDAIKKALENT